jgi:polyisoprenyl-teichoic acid--peptidoglycan teichoic acid transferase
VRGLGVAVLAIFGALIVAGSWSAFRLAEMSTRPLSVAGSGGPQRIVMLGYGGGDHPGAYLSDSIVLVVSDGGKQAEVSIPRDLWVQLPPDSGRYAKINEALQQGYDSGGLDVGAQLAAQKVADVTGLSVTGWVLQDFEGFRNLIDALGGVDVDVPRAFSAQYPVNDNPDVDARWKMIHFDAGRQHMNGDQALEYARARYADTPEEASDFARAQRQQLLIASVRQKVTSPAGGLHFLPLVNAAADAIHTNVSPVDLGSFVASFHPDQAKHIALDSVLVDGRSADGQQILLPRSGNYALISEYVKSQLS